MRNLTSVSQKITPVDFHTADAHAGMGRFQQARRDGPARVMGDPRIARGAPISAADAIAAFNRQRASGPDDFGERANAYRQRWGFEQQAGSREAQSALSNAPQARLHEGGWQDRRAYGDGAKQPADGIWPPPAEPGDDAASEEVEGTPSEHADDEPSRTTPSKRGDEDDLSRTAKYMARRMDAYNASIAAKGPRAFPPPGPNAGRWEQQAGVREPTRHGPDVHAGRHEDRAFYGDGGDRNVWVPFDVRDAQHGFARHAGRWEERAKWRDAPYLDSQKFVNHGHYAQHIGRDNWERGAYLRQDRGVHEGRWRDGVWDEGLWQRRAGWAHAPTRKDDPVAGPQGQAPIGPRNEDSTLAGVWEERANFQHDDDGFPRAEVGPLGHVRRDAKRHEGRWEQRGEWGKGRVHPKLEHKSDVHEGRWEDRAQFKGAAKRDVGVAAKHETPQARAARIAAEQRAYAAWRDGRKGDIDADDESDTHAASGPTWAGDEPAGNLANPSIHCGPTPLWNAPTVNLPGGSEMRRKAAAGRATRGDLKEDKENELESGGNFAAWLERGERGYTRTPGDLREVYTAGDNANAERGNNQYARRHVDLLGARSVHPVTSDVAPSLAPSYRTSAAEVSATAEEARWEEENRSRGSGLSNMASMRDAIKSASLASTERTTRSRSHLSSHVGVV